MPTDKKLLRKRFFALLERSKSRMTISEIVTLCGREGIWDGLDEEIIAAGRTKIVKDWLQTKDKNGLRIC
jgi:hypothetical protein